jgi:hypothetical protein
MDRKVGFHPESARASGARRILLVRKSDTRWLVMFGLNLADRPKLDGGK